MVTRIQRYYGKDDGNMAPSDAGGWCRSGDVFTLERALAVSEQKTPTIAAALEAVFQYSGRTRRLSVELVKEYCEARQFRGHSDVRYKVMGMIAEVHDMADKCREADAAATRMAMKSLEG